MGNNPVSDADPDGHQAGRVLCSDGIAGQCGIGTYPGAEGIYSNDGMTSYAPVEGQDNLQEQSYNNWLTSAQAQQQSSNSSGASTDYASVSDYPTGAGGFHHTGIAVDSDDTHGFSTADPSTPWWKRLFGAPKGRMEDDIDMHKNSDGVVARHSYIHIPITAAQAAAMRAAIADRTANPGRYNLLFRNCAGAVEGILHAGGVSGIPHGEVNIPFVLHDVLLLERGSQ